LESWLWQSPVPYIVDYDDAVFHRYDLNPNALVRLLLRNKIDMIMKSATIVTAGNDYIAKRARRAGARRIEILPSVIDLKRYSVVPVSRGEVFTIGWIGTPVTSPYLGLVQAALRELSASGKFRLVTVGSGKLKLPDLPVESRDWSEETEAACLREFNVGIMPLPDTPWTKGKCGYKLIQYMACGLPVVASPVGVNQEIVDHGITGFHATTTADWVRHLATLYSDHNLCHNMGSAGRRKVETHYSLNVTAPKLLTLMEEAFRSRGAGL
jgi:glycosyltransferase involved in cell wall biosynthesis